MRTRATMTDADRWRAYACAALSGMLADEATVDFKWAVRVSAKIASGMVQEEEKRFKECGNYRPDYSPDEEPT